MKKTLVVFCNAKVGGIQKALISFLKDKDKKEDITLLLFYKGGALLQEIPSNVRIIESNSDYKYMGMSQSDCITIKDKIKRGIYATICKTAGKEFVVNLISKTVRLPKETKYDEAIAYNHVTYEHYLYGGVPQYVLNHTNAKKKTCYIHCDYLNSGTRSTYSENIYKCFDEIVCVSESTKERFIEAIPELKEKTVARYNPIDRNEIIRKSMIDPYQYDLSYINFITVARLGREKGILRVIEALHKTETEKVKYYIVGDGYERDKIEKKIEEYGLAGNIILLGEQDNPYRFMRNADLLIVPSYHEAAPVVFQEAIALDLPILTTRTTSADEMVGETHGIVVENEDKAIEEELARIIKNPGLIIKRFSESELECESRQTD